MYPHGYRTGEEDEETDRVRERSRSLPQNRGRPDSNLLDSDPESDDEGEGDPVGDEED